ACVKCQEPKAWNQRGPRGTSAHIWAESAGAVGPLFSSKRSSAVARSDGRAGGALLGAGLRSREAADPESDVDGGSTPFERTHLGTSSASMRAGETTRPPTPAGGQVGDCHRHPTVPTDPVDTLSPMPTITVIIDDRHEGTRLKITMPRSLVEDLLAHGEERW